MLPLFHIFFNISSILCCEKSEGSAKAGLEVDSKKPVDEEEESGSYDIFENYDKINEYLASFFSKVEDKNEKMSEKNIEDLQKKMKSVWDELIENSLAIIEEYEKTQLKNIQDEKKRETMAESVKKDKERLGKMKDEKLGKNLNKDIKKDSTPDDIKKVLKQFEDSLDKKRKEIEDILKEYLVE